MGYAYQVSLFFRTKFFRKPRTEFCRIFQMLHYRLLTSVFGYVRKIFFLHVVISARTPLYKVLHIGGQ